MHSSLNWTVIGLPEPEGVLQRGGHRIVFFDVEGLPRPDQLTLITQHAPGWSLLCWGLWDDDTGIDDIDLATLDSWGNSPKELKGITAEEAFSQFQLPTSGIMVDDELTAPPARWEKDQETLTQIIPGRLVAVDASPATAVSVCEWQGVANAGTPAELTQVLERWNKQWGLEVLGFGDMEEADLVACIASPPEDLTEIVNTLRTGCDEVTFVLNTEYGLLIHLWWD